jgi:hypothetical protein
LDTIKLLIGILSSKAASPAAAAAAGIADPTAAAPAAKGAISSSSSKAPSTAASKARAAAAAAGTAAASAAAVQLRHGCLTALAALAVHSECTSPAIAVARQKMVAEHSGKLIQVVVAALSDPVADVRGAAALCLRGLCRSARLLRCGSIPADVAAPLVTLLQDASASDVQVRA